MTCLAPHRLHALENERPTQLTAVSNRQQHEHLSAELHQARHLYESLLEELGPEIAQQLRDPQRNAGSSPQSIPEPEPAEAAEARSTLFIFSSFVWFGHSIRIIFECVSGIDFSRFQTCFLSPKSPAVILFFYTYEHPFDAGTCHGTWPKRCRGKVI